MKLNFKKFITQFTPFFIGLMVLHFLLYRGLPNHLGINMGFLAQTYLFMGVITLVHFLSLRWLFSRWPKYAGLLFTGISLLKMAVSLLFLLPFIFPSTEQSVACALNFMVAYFFILFFELIFLVKNMGLNHVKKEGVL